MSEQAIVLLSLAGGIIGYFALTVSLYVGAMITDVDILSYRRCLLYAIPIELAAIPLLWFSPTLNPAVVLTGLAVIVAVVPILSLAWIQRSSPIRAIYAGLAHLAIFTAMFLVFCVLILGGIEQIPSLLAGENVFENQVGM